MKSNVIWVMIFTVLCLFCTAVWFAADSNHEEKIIAQIKQGNNIINTINLSEVTEPYEIKVTDEHGAYNIVRIEHNRIAVTDADCPDKICVNQGYIENSAVPIVCLPHKLSVTIISGGKDIDEVAGGM